MKLKIFISLFSLMFFQILCSQNSKKWIIKTDSLPTNKILVNLLAEQNIDNDSLLFIKANVLREKFEIFGYFNLEMEHISNDSLIYTSIKLNQKIDKLIIQHPDIEEFPKFYQYQILKKDQIEIPIEETSDFLTELSNYYQNNGFPFAKVFLKNLNQVKNSMYGELNIDKGKRYKIDKIVLKGYENFPKKFIKYKLQLNESQYFNKDEIQNISNLLKSLNFVSEIKKPEVLFTNDTTYIYLYLQREKNNKIDGIIGFSNSENSKGIKLQGYLDLNLQNAFNKGEQISFNWLSDGNKSQSLKLSTDIPYILNTPLGLDYEMEMYKKDTTFFNFSNDLNLNYLIDYQHKIGFQYSTLSSNMISNQLIENMDQFTSRFYGVSYQFTLPNDSKLFPIKFELKTNGLKGKRNEINQFKWDTELLYILRVNSNNYFSLKSKTAFLISDVYIDNEVFRIGGINNIRGFRENSLLANKYSYFNLGYHFITDENSYLSLLSDIGVLKQTNLDYIYSVGLGYRFSSPNGLFTINYFIGNNTASAFSFKNSFLQFSLSQYF